MTPATVDWLRDHLRALSVIEIDGPVGHFLPEDRPAEVAEALIAWVQTLA